jgi:hypothetical protein
MTEPIEIVDDGVPQIAGTEAMTDRELLDFMYAMVADLHFKMAQLQDIIDGFNDNSAIVAKLQAIVSEFVASGGVGAVLPMLGGF